MKKLMIAAAVVVVGLFGFFFIRELDNGSGTAAREVAEFTLPATEREAVAFEAAELYQIENEKFGIRSDGTAGAQTKEGLNAALLYAAENGYPGAKLDPGTYLIQCNWDNPYETPDDGILVPDNMIFDLTGATLKIQANDQPAYNIIYALGENIVINGGHLIGDRDEHEYAADTQFMTHEWGAGINVVGAKNVVVQNVKIEQMTGDGVTMRGTQGSNSEQVAVIGCEIFACRRQGISVTGSLNGTISGNRIYDIGGTDPGYGIDIEVNEGYDAAGLLITQNEIWDCENGSIFCCNSQEYTVRENILRNGGIRTGNTVKRIIIAENILENSQILVNKKAADILLQDNQLDADSKVVEE